MFKLIKRYRREFVYSSYLFLIFELLTTPQFTLFPVIYSVVITTGFLLIISWLVHTYTQFAPKKISKYSEVLLKLNLKSRLFTHVIMPILFYSMISLFLLVNRNIYIDQIVIVLSVISFFFLFLHIRTSYERVFYIARKSRIVYDAISILMLYFSISAILQVTFSWVITSMAVLLLSFLALLYMLYWNNKVSGSGLLVAIFCSLALWSLSILLQGRNIFIYPAIITIIYYMIVSIWHVRFSGSTDYNEYIPPVMYTLMALILIMSL